MTKRMGLSYLTSLYLLLSCLLLFLLPTSNSVAVNEELQTYIIHLDHSHKPASLSTQESWHRTILKSLSDPVNDQEMLLYSYNHVMQGFSARLTRSQLSEIETSPAHLATYKESFGKLYTTYSTQFLGLKGGLGIWPTAADGKGVIIGIIDTGIWPESESFADKGMPPVPQRWKGECENGTAFSPSMCNKKLIGARSFSKGLIAAGRKIDPDLDYDSARDYFGHGTHTSSTAAGSYVPGVSHFGYARGTARGVATAAHVAMYKVLFATDSVESAATDVLAGMDQAIADGVDIMSLSLGFDQTPYFNDVIAIASLSAVEKGIVVVCATGNDGPGRNTTHNAAPWITTVGAGTLDRTFTATMNLENGFSVEGMSYYPQSVYIADAPLYYGSSDQRKATCSLGSLNQSEVHRKVVFCENNNSDPHDQVEEVQRVGALAGIFSTDSLFLDAEDYTIPSLVLPAATGKWLKIYLTELNITKVKSIKFVSTKFGVKPAPQVASFSSRGPDPINPGILKPDVLAPGVDILAAVNPTIPIIELGKYDLVSDYALYSGTSMAAPHVAGVAALLKALHPEWSPAAIRSAIMTTTYTVDNNGTILTNQETGLPATPLEFGAGHINPNKAMDPGLIYDLNLQDYIGFLCSLGYTNKQMAAVLRRSQWSCNNTSSDLNYPSFMAVSNSSSPLTKKFNRVVTNVGNDASVYRATVEVPQGMKVTIEPSTLSFSSKYQTQSFSVSLEVDKDAPAVIYGYLRWVDQYKHVVSSPIVAVNFSK